MSKMKKALIGVMVFTLVLAGLTFIRLNNAYNATKIYNTCYILPEQLALFHVKGYNLEIYELSGTYYVQGMYMLMPFEELISQKELETIIESDISEQIPCTEEEQND